MTIAVADPNTRTFTLRRAALDAKLAWSPKDEHVVLELLDEQGVVAARADDNGRIRREDLPGGAYAYRVSGQVTQPADFVVKSTQGR